MTAYDAYELTQAGLACDAGDQAACNTAKEMMTQFGIEIGVTLTIGQIIPGDKIGMKIMSALRKNGNKDVVEATEKAAEKFKGGSHKDTSKPIGDGLDSHHCPAKWCYQERQLAVLMVLPSKWNQMITYKR